MTKTNSSPAVASTVHEAASNQKKRVVTALKAALGHYAALDREIGVARNELQAEGHNALDRQLAKAGELFRLSSVRLKTLALQISEGDSE